MLCFVSAKRHIVKTPRLSTSKAEYHFLWEKNLSPNALKFQENLAKPRYLIFFILLSLTLIRVHLVVGMYDHVVGGLINFWIERGDADGNANPFPRLFG